MNTRTTRRVYTQLFDGDSYFIKWGSIDRQYCCDCALVHDVTYKLRRGGVEIYTRKNERCTQNERRRKVEDSAIKSCGQHRKHS